jgi:hypothetical protein
VGGFVDNANGIPLSLHFDAPNGMSYATPPFTPDSDHFPLRQVGELTNATPTNGNHRLWSTSMTVALNLRDANGATIATVGSIPVNGCPIGLHTDFDGNGTADIAVFRPSNGNWYLQNLATAPYSSSRHNVVVHYGAQGDIPVPADWNSDGVTDVAVFRPSSGAWHLPRGIVHWGAPGDIPVPGFYVNFHDPFYAVFRPSSGNWLIPGRTVHWGAPGDIPVPGDYNGDGLMEIAVYRPSTGVWHIRNAHPEATRWGASHDIPVPSFFNRAGVTDIVTFRPSNGTWYRYGARSVHFGTNGDVPVPLDYFNQGETERIVFRPSNGGWYIGNGPPWTHWGTAGDIPIRPLL